MKKALATKPAQSGTDVYPRCAAEDLLRLVACGIVKYGGRRIPHNNLKQAEAALYAFGEHLREEAQRLYQLAESSGGSKDSAFNLLEAAELFYSSQSTGSLDTFWNTLSRSPLLRVTSIGGRVTSAEFSITTSHAERELSQAAPAWRAFIEREVPAIVAAF